MLKTRIVSNIKLRQEWIDEVETLFPELDISIAYIDVSMPAVYNKYFKTNWGDFNWIRNLIGDADVRAFITSYKLLKEQGITGHYGMYDVYDSDLNYDLYIGLPDKLTSRAKANGFRSNFAWILIHEIIHGMESHISGPDRTHEMEKQGRLLELLGEHRQRHERLIKIESLLQKIKNIYASFSFKKTN